jgi:hypothetical protein
MELKQPCALLWHGIRSKIRKEYKNGYIILDVAYIAHAIDLIAKHYKITQCTDDVIAQLCDFLQKRGFVVEQTAGHITISWPFYFLGPHQTNV